MAPSTALRLAHRGDWRDARENTIPAFAAALAIQACDGLEFDVRTSSDGVPVIYHDDTLARVHGRPDRVDSLPASALQAIGVPTLWEALTAVGRKAFLDVELKSVIGPAFVEVMAAGRGPGLERAVVSSYDPTALDRVGHLAPNWPRWFIADRLDDDAIVTASRLGCRAVAAGWRSLDAGSIGAATTAGLEVAAFTVRGRSTFDRLARLGVSAMCVEGAALDG